MRNFLCRVYAADRQTDERADDVTDSLFPMCSYHYIIMIINDASSGINMPTHSMNNM